MSWYKVSLTSQEIIAGKGIRLQDQFLAVFMANGLPKDAAMFCSRSPHENDYYFTPEASRIGSKLIASYGGTGCPQPAGTSLALLVANDRNWSEFLFPHRR